MGEIMSMMTIEQLVALFPNMSKVKLPHTDPTAIIKYQGESWYLMDTELSERECQLLALHGVMVEQLVTSMSLTAQQEAWQQFLLSQGALPVQPFRNKERVQVLYIYVQGLNQGDSPMFAQLLNEAVEGLAVLFPQTSNFWIGVLSEGIDCEVLQSVLQTLEIDFAVSIQAVLGLENTLSYEMAQRAMLEWEFVKESLPLQVTVSGMLLTLPDLVLRMLRVHVGHSYVALQHVAHYLRDSREMAQIVEVLFQTQGNLSQAAEMLYIHRNTLMYRLAKYTKETGLNLQVLPDLMVSYLALGGKEV